MKAADIMTTSVVCIKPDATVLDAARLLLSERISALPVVDTAGRLQGIVSEGDLIHRAEIGSEKHVTRWKALFEEGAALARDYLKAHGRKVSDVMSHPVVLAEEDTELSVVAARMDQFGIKRLPVVRDGKVVGIVSRANLLQALISAPTAGVAPAVDDAALRDQILQKLDREPWSASLLRNIIVQDGKVEIWGHADSISQCEACGVLAAGIPGVKAVTNHMVVTPRGVYTW
ncbi:MAG: CBS domain-containing protein [Rhodospirillales bacterium]|nr:CBS domain-containing protein [Rhodospirillales bacterium]